jgi:hypothetical protein
LLLLEQRSDQPQRADELRADLLRRQNADGGWGWKQPAPSDTFATGQALYALTKSPNAQAAPAVEHARQYLLKTQAVDGSWAVPPSAISSANAEARLKRLMPIYQYWGTAWAVIGLSGTIQK